MESFFLYRKKSTMNNLKKKLIGIFILFWVMRKNDDTHQEKSTHIDITVDFDK